MNKFEYTNFDDHYLWRTFKEWSVDGYMIRKGSKGTRAWGKVYFHRSQVIDNLTKHEPYIGDDTYWEQQ